MRFEEKLKDHGYYGLRADGLTVLQVNLGYSCNLSCKHCHVDGGPNRREIMDDETASLVLEAIRGEFPNVLDLTGGAPEMNPNFRSLVKEARSMGKKVIVRTNLVVLLEENFNDLPEFLSDNCVEIVASLPHYRQENVDRIRGIGVFDKSISVLQRLNSLGYGIPGSGLNLSLVFNPQGAFLPSAQAEIEEEYRRELGERYGVTFDKLLVFTNMPIGRFRVFLEKTGNLVRYMESLRCAFNPTTVDGVMCRQLLNVGWDGTLYDCDFNQMSGIKLRDEYPGHLRDFDRQMLSSRLITVGDHCFGCTAGQGST